MMTEGYLGFFASRIFSELKQKIAFLISDIGVIDNERQFFSFKSLAQHSESQAATNFSGISLTKRFGNGLW